MRKYYKTFQEGFTLLEVLMVLGIAGLLFVLGVKMYQSLQVTLEMQEVKANVDQLFDAASNYYKANCATGGFSPSGTVTYPPSATAYYPVSIPAILLSDGFLENWNTPNPYVDPSSGDGLGYVVQLNPVVYTGPIPINACVVLTPAATPPGSSAPNSTCMPITPANVNNPTTAYSAAPFSTTSHTQAVIVTWKVQVAVKLKPQEKVAVYSKILGADCTSGSSNPGTVDPCSAGNVSSQYAVWSRTPSFGSVHKSSVFNLSMPLLNQYKLQYTHDQDYEFNSGYSTSTAPLAPVYYLCGG